jgi:Protein of unknown function (DUF3987)
MKTEKRFIDLKKLLQLTDNGRLIFEMILPDLHRESENRYRNTLNPFYPDTKPGLSIYQTESGDWRYHDHGEPSYSGDAIDLAAIYYGMDRTKEFKMLLNKIADDLLIDRSALALALNDKPFITDWRKDEEGIDEAYRYFAKFGVTKDILRKYSIRAVKKYPFVDKDGNLQWHNFARGLTTIAYETPNHCKFYTPGSYKEGKFFILGSKDPHFIFGKDPICDDMNGAGNFDRGPLIITGGEKDVLTLVALGYDAITLNSETASLPDHLNDFLSKYVNIVVLYDIDRTGKKHAAELSNKHKFSICTLPEELSDKGGKDVSDYVELGMSIDNLHQLIADCIALKSTMNTPAKPAQEAMSSFNVSITQQPTDASSLQTDSDATPLLPLEIYSLIPQMLKTLCDQFEDRRERDINLLSCITIMSSCFPTIKGVYGEFPIGCNINLFISAPASAGKGTMSWSRMLGTAINKSLEEKYKVEYAMYEEDLAKYHSKDKDENMPRPIEPVQKRLFIPANSSCASIYEHLSANEAFGIIFDTEADTMSSTMKNDWGDYSYLLRKAFHHEPAELSRRKDREFLKVESPHLSVLLSGTRNQVNKLINSVENGLFSRFLFYDFNAKVEWRDMFGSGDYSRKKLFDSYSQCLLDFWARAESSGEVVFIPSMEEREFVTAYYTRKLQELYSIYGDDIVANVKRTCIMYYRIAMILSTIHYMDSPASTGKKMPNRLYLDKEQSRCSFLIIDTLLTHLEFVYTRMQKTGALAKLNPQQRSIFEALPKEFTWAEFKSAAEEIGIRYGTVEKYRRDLIKSKLILSIEHGKYRKN